jgi:hypothetical protein
MDTESVDESSRSTVSSLKSRFEQLATREIKNGPEERTQVVSGTVRPASQDRPRSVDEQKPRASFDGNTNLGDNDLYE